MKNKTSHVGTHKHYNCRIWKDWSSMSVRAGGIGKKYMQVQMGFAKVSVEVD